MTNVEINSLTGVEPFHIYICDQLQNNCIYIDTILNSDITYIFPIPPVYEGLESFFIKAIDKNQCVIYFEILR